MKPSSADGRWSDDLWVLWEGKGLILGTVAAVVLLTLIGVWLWPKRYEAHVRLVALSPLSERLSERARLEAQPAGSLTLRDLPPLLGTFPPAAYQELALAEGVLQAALQRAALPEMADVPPEQLKRRLRVEVAPRVQPDDPLLLTLTVSGTRPQALADLAEAWAQALIERSARFARDTLQAYVDFLAAQVQEARALWAEQEATRDRFQEEHPLIVWESELKGRRQRYEALLAEGAVPEELVAELVERSVRLDQARRQLNRLDRQRERTRRWLELLEERLQEAQLALAEPFDSLQVFEGPLVPRAPLGPNLALYTALAAVVGLLVGVLGAFLRAQLRLEERP